jgi:hypothetical protein
LAPELKPWSPFLIGRLPLRLWISGINRLVRLMKQQSLVTTAWAEVATRHDFHRSARFSVRTLFETLDGLYNSIDTCRCVTIHAQCKQWE